MIEQQIVIFGERQEPAVSFYSAIQTVTETSISSDWNAEEDFRRAHPAINRVGAGMDSILPRVASVV